MESDFETLLNGQQFKRLYDKRSNRITEKYGLHKIEMEILLFLKKRQLDTARDIAETKYFSKAHISHAIEHLMECGYLIGKPDEQDRRCVHLILTKEAEPVCEELLQLRRGIMDIVYRNITEEEKEVLLRVAKRIARNMDEELML